MNSKNCIEVFQRSINDYHRYDRVDAPMQNPYQDGSLEYLLYLKNWIDTVQWHLEDLIRNPLIEPIEALKLKRKIDESNQRRTDVVEYVDSWLLEEYRDIRILPNATINTESPAWAVDRLSILELKIYHMQIEALRKDASEEHRNTCQGKLDILFIQRNDLSLAIDQLIDDIAAGRKYMKVYRQMKMYNDDSLNPVLYQKKGK
jgi:hypothetical protein